MISVDSKNLYKNPRLQHPYFTKNVLPQQLTSVNLDVTIYLYHKLLLSIWFPWELGVLTLAFTRTLRIGIMYSYRPIIFFPALSY